jgi:2'-5' RNA ligase
MKFYSNYFYLPQVLLSYITALEDKDSLKQFCYTKTSMNSYFIGLKLGMELDQVLHPIKTKHADQNIIWQVPEDLHITLVAPWQENNEVSIIQKLTPIVARHQALTLELSKLKVVPNLMKPRMLWLLVKKDLKLDSLQHDLMQTLGFENKKSFLPHVTLSKSQDFLTAQLEQDLNYLFYIDEVYLFQTTKDITNQYKVKHVFELSV